MGTATSPSWPKMTLSGSRVTVWQNLKISFSDYPYAEKPDNEEAVADNLIYCTPGFRHMNESLDNPQDEVDVEEPVPVSVSVTESQTLGLVDRNIDLNS